MPARYKAPQWTTPAGVGISFSDNDILFVDPKREVAIGRPCVYLCDDVVIGVYEEINNEPVLVFSNPRFPVVKIKDKKYLGRIISRTTAYS